MLMIVSHTSVVLCGGKRPYPIHSMCERALNSAHVYCSVQWARCTYNDATPRQSKLELNVNCNEQNSRVLFTENCNEMLYVFCSLPRIMHESRLHMYKFALS